MDTYEYVQMDGKREMATSQILDDNKKDNSVKIIKEIYDEPNDHIPYKIIAQLSERDAYKFINEKNAIIMPTYAIRGKKHRIMGPPLSIEAESETAFVEKGSGEARKTFPSDSYNRALEIIW